jgi:hypothetical protein
MIKPQEGDLVRIVTEGVVAYTHPEGGVILENHYEYFPDDEGVISIEVITPPFVLPTKRFAQVVENYTAGGMETVWTLETPLGSARAFWYNINGYRLFSEDLLKRDGLFIIREGV